MKGSAVRIRASAFRALQEFLLWRWVRLSGSRVQNGYARFALPPAPEHVTRVTVLAAVAVILCVVWAQRARVPAEAAPQE